MTKNVLITFGSPNDKDKYLTTDFLRLPDTNYWLSANSAHRVPEVVARHAGAMKYDGIIAGAGMKNALMDKYFELCRDAIHVALPITDPRTGGLSSMLSSSEMPPGCPVAMSRMNDMNAAVDFMNYAISINHSRVRIETDGNEASLIIYYDAVKMLEKLSVDVIEDPSVPAIDIVTYSDPDALQDFDVRQHVIACFALPIGLKYDPATDTFSTPPKNLGLYLYSMERSPHAVHTGVADGKNIALYAAKMIARNNPELKARMKDRFDREVKEKYDSHRMLSQL